MKSKAAIYTKFGKPEVLKLVSIDKPVPKENEVLIRIYATTVEKEDPSMRKSPGINGIFKPKRQILGMEFSGKIEDIGNKVAKYKVGDEVFGNTGMSLGTYAEYKCLSEDGGLALKPANINFEEAASVTNGSLTAIPFLRDKGKIKQGDKVLINGASGSVGSAAVQIAKYYGASVTGVCSTKNVELVKSLGADQVIDYTKKDFTKSNEKYDIVFDVAGKTSFSKCKGIMKNQTVYLATVPTLAIMLQMLWTKSFGSKKVKFIAAGLRSGGKKAKDLALLKEIVESGKLKSVIDKQFPLEQIVDAHKHVEKGGKIGSVVVTIN